MTTRIRKEIEKLSLRYIRSISQRTNPLQCDIYFSGPVGSVYALNVFHILVEFPESYPFQPPTVTFLQELNIPEVDQSTGRLRMKLLDPRAWNVTSGLLDILTCLYYVLKTQIPAEPDEPHTETTSLD